MTFRQAVTSGSRSTVITAVVVLSISCEGRSAPVDAGPDAGEEIAAGDGYHRIVVEQPHGPEEMWIYASSPSDPGPHPVVVYAHGQGATNLINCNASGRPDHADVGPSVALADALAREGYLTVAVFYRHMGDVAPDRGPLKFRDHLTLDVRSLLTAARWGRSDHGAGSGQVAFVGTSMGTYPAFYAGTSRPEWSDLQEELDVRLVAIAGMFLNHLANSRQNLHRLVTSDADAELAEAILALSLASTQARASASGLGMIEAADLAEGGGLRPEVERSLKPIAIDLFRQLVLGDPGALGLGDCSSDAGRAICDSGCGVAVLARAFEGRTAPVDLSQWLEPDAVALASYWDPTAGADPTTEPADSLVGIARDISPVFSNHTMVAPRVLPLLSASDHTFEEQGQAAADALRALLVDRLAVTTVAEVPGIDSDAAGSCGHGDYFLPARPRCGWADTLAALEVAFSP